MSRQVVELATALFDEHGFELPITLTLVKPDRAVGVLSCSFDRSDADETRRAHALYRAIYREFEAIGILPYRRGILDMNGSHVHDPGKHEIISSIKAALDPNGVIAPGRYGVL